jgi:2,3-bisphosphoglycerate-dependent phosphoglycerate mutase
MSTVFTEFLFIRHGETQWNREHRFQGQSNPPLNDTGLFQAQRLGARLAQQRSGRLLSSDLQRALQTAEPLARHWRVGIEPWPGLREQAFGELEGWTVQRVQQEQPELWRHWLQQDPDFALPGGGESQRQFYGRVRDAVDDLAKRFAGECLTVVTHGGVLDMLWRAAHGLPPSGLRQCEIPNTGLNRLRWQAGRLSILGWADAAHLADQPPLAPLAHRPAVHPADLAGPAPLITASSSQTGH